MARPHVHWDLEDDPEGNYWHIVVDGHGVTREEVDDVLYNRRNETAKSREHDSWVTFGYTSTGRYILVAWEHAGDDPLTMYPLTAYPVPEPGPRKRRR